MPKRIGPKQPVKLYLAEHREKYGLTQQQVADRLGTSDVTISRWETGERRPDVNAQAAYAEALRADMHFTELWRDPARPSADDLLRDQPQEVVEQALNIIRAIRRA